MAKTTISSGNVAQVWDAKFFEEYIRANQFNDYMGTTENSVLQVKENLTKKRGDVINIALVKQLTGSGVTGATTLKGNEEALSNYGHGINIDVIRNGVVVNELEEQKSEIAIRDAARTMLKHWAMDRMRDDIISAMESPNVDGVTTWADSDATARNAWLVANRYRVLFGAAESNYSGVHATDFAKVDNTNDKLTPSVVSLAKLMAKRGTDGAIRPIRVDGGGEWYVMFVGPLPFRDLKAHATMTQSNREAWVRGKDNPLFRDGDLMWDGVIIREVTEIPVRANTTPINCSANFLCGAQALGMGWAQRTTSRTEIDDYGFEHGVAVQEMRGIEKMTFNDVQHGMVTVYTAAVT